MGGKTLERKGVGRRSEKRRRTRKGRKGTAEEGPRRAEMLKTGGDERSRGQGD